MEQGSSWTVFSTLSLAERTAVQEYILTEIKGRMLEEHCYGPITGKFALYCGKTK